PVMKPTANPARNVNRYRIWHLFRRNERAQDDLPLMPSNTPGYAPVSNCPPQAAARPSPAGPQVPSRVRYPCARGDSARTPSRPQSAPAIPRSSIGRASGSIPVTRTSGALFGQVRRSAIIADDLLVTENSLISSGGEPRPRTRPVNSRALCRLSYSRSRGIRIRVGGRRRESTRVEPSLPGTGDRAGCPTDVAPTPQYSYR